jgi:hypothetical protein
MRLQRLTNLRIAALALGLTACAGGQTGDLSGERDEGNETGNGSGCEEHKQELGGLDEQTEAGSAEEVLSYAEGSFSAPLSWRTAPEGQSWSTSPESGQGTITLYVTRGEKAYLLTYSAKPDRPGEEVATVGVICPPPQIGVEAHVSVATAGGALAEEYDTLLRSSTSGMASLSLPVDLQKLGGELSVSLSESNAKFLQTRLEATLTEVGMTGTLGGLEQVQHGTGSDSAVSAAPALLAVWPDSPACQAFSKDGDGLAAPISETVLGVKGTETIGSVVPAEAREITWLDGSKTTLSVSVASTGDGCLRNRDELPVVLDGGPGVRYPVELTLESADGRVRGAYAAEVLAVGAGSERRVMASAYLTVGADELDKTGFEQVSIPSGSESLMLVIDSKLKQGVVSGSVSLFALSSPPCATQPPPQMSSPGMGAGSPGCAGQTQTQLEVATWDD